MPSVYLDHNATTPLAPEVLEDMLPFLRDHYGNASSIHSWGQRTRKAVEEAREKVAAAVGARASEIVFTSGGTEGDNTALIGAAEARRDRGRHIVTSVLEHPAVLRACDRLEEADFEVTRLPSGPNGRVTPDQFAASLRPDTIMASLMFVNNETGTIQPIPEIAAICRERGVLFHTDAVQAIGKIPVDVGHLPVDLLCLTGHKFHGPKGAGAMYVREGTVCRSYLLGGGQERGRRGGTENVAAIVGLGSACQQAIRHLEDVRTRIRDLRDRLEAGLCAADPAVRVNGDPAHRAPHVSNLSFVGLEGETILVSFDFLGIAVSTGAACAAGSVSPSHVLVGMGLEKQRVQGAIRFSLGRSTTAEEIDFVLAEAPAVLRRIREAGFRR